VHLPLDVGEHLLQAIEGAMEREQIPDGVAERSPSGFQSQQADAFVAIVKTYLEGKSGSDSSSTANRYQVVVHVDEAALHGGAGRSDAPLETVKRLACDASVVVVTEDERGTPLTVSASSALSRRPSGGRFGLATGTALSRAVSARGSSKHTTFIIGPMAEKRASTT
jgi:hypothetical protein